MKYKKMLISLPEPLVEKLAEYAAKSHGGNKSGFVAQAIEDKIERLYKVAYTEKMRDAYRTSAKRNQAMLKEWRYVDAQTAQILEDSEKE